MTAAPSGARAWSAHAVRLEAVAEGAPLPAPPSLAGATRAPGAGAALAAALEAEGPLPPELQRERGIGGDDEYGAGAASGDDVAARVQGWLAASQQQLGAAGDPTSSAVVPAGAMIAVPAGCSAPNPLARAAGDAGAAPRLPPGAAAALAYAAAAAAAPARPPYSAPPYGQPYAVAAGAGGPGGGNVGGGRDAAGGGGGGDGRAAAAAGGDGGGGGDDDDGAGAGAIALSHVIPAEELTLLARIGQGAEGRVFLGRWNQIEVAAKEFFTGAEGDAEGGGAVGGGGGAAGGGAGGAAAAAAAGEARARAALLREVRTLAALTTHPNVVRLCGVCLRPPLVVTEFYPNGSLYQMLARARKQLESGRGSQRVRAGCMFCVVRVRACVRWGMSLRAAGERDAGLRAPNVSTPPSPPISPPPPSSLYMSALPCPSVRLPFVFRTPPRQCVRYLTWARRLEMLHDVAAGMM